MHWCEFFINTQVNNGSGNGLVPDGTKPLPEPMLTWDLMSHKITSDTELNPMYSKQENRQNSKHVRFFLSLESVS